VDPFETTLAHLNYAANNGIGPMAETYVDQMSTTRQTGAFSLNSWKSPAQISDGLSNTAFVSEIRAIATSDFRGLQYPEGLLYHHNFTPNSLVQDQMREKYCVSVPDAPCAEAFPSWSPRNLTLTTRSMHPGGVNLLLGDGSATFISDSISSSTWKALSSPNGGEINDGNF
jgi:prepilin-type processing-associated H-X9-DG protein